MATYQDFARLFLKDIGAPDTPTNERFVIGWETAEGTRAAYNPLATTQHAQGSTQFNSAGVQNFTSLQQGAQVNASLLERKYLNVLAALRADDAAALGESSGHVSAGVWSDLGIWTTGNPDAPVGTYISHILGGGGNAARLLGTFQGQPDTSVPVPPGEQVTTPSAPVPAVHTPLQINAGILLAIGATILILLVAAGTIKARSIAQAAPAPPGGQK